VKTKGVYYLPSADMLLLISKVEFYEDMFTKPFSIVTWESFKGVYKKVLITSDQFKRFKRIGTL